MLVDCPDRELHHVLAPSGHVLDQTILLQLRHCLSQRPPADPQLLGQGHLDQAFPSGELAAED